MCPLQAPFDVLKLFANKQVGHARRMFKMRGSFIGFGFHTA
jgi:hypothetical protein